MTVARAIIGIVAGFVAGVLSGAFGVGGGIVTTPVVHLLLGGAPIEAVATPLPVIFPTALAGAWTYRRAGEVSFRAAGWAVAPGMIGAVAGAELTNFPSVFHPHLLLFVTAVLLGAQAIRIGFGGELKERPRGSTPGWQYMIAGGLAGFVSGLLGLGGGIVFVPILTAILGMPLKRALGTSLVVIAAVVIPGTIDHAIHDHINWPAFAVLVVGVIPGAWIGATLALRARDRTLRLAVGTFLLLIAIGYGALELYNLIRAA